MSRRSVILTEISTIMHQCELAEHEDCPQSFDTPTGKHRVVCVCPCHKEVTRDAQ